MPRWDVLCIGAATRDDFLNTSAAVVLEVEGTRYLAFPHSRKLTVETFIPTTGGGATNAAAAFARLGMRVACVSAVGSDDAGREVIRDLERFGVDTRYVTTRSGEQTTSSVILTGPGGDRVVLVHRGASVALSPEDLDLEGARQARAWYLTSVRGQTAAFIPYVLREVHERGIHLAWNPGSLQVAQGLDALREVVAACRLFLLNVHEAERFTGRDVRDAGVDGLLETLRETGARRVVLTDGQAGAWAAEGDTVCFAPAYDVEVASTLGAGDAFGAGLVTALMRDEPLTRAMQLGAACAAGAVRGWGAKDGLLTWDQAIALVDAHPNVQVTQRPLGAP